MKNLAINSWIPTSVALPDNNRIVIIQTEELPDPTIGSYWADRGIWVHDETLYEDLGNITVTAWREMPKAYQPKEFEYRFRSVQEARRVTIDSLKRIKEGKDEPEFFEIREEVLHAATQGLFEVRRAYINEKNQAALIAAGYKVTQTNDGWIISWGK